MPVLDNSLLVWNNAELTNTTETGATYAIDQQVVTRHMENGEEVGFGVFVTALASSGATYNFKVKNVASATDVITSAIDVAQTGAMTDTTDPRINASVAGFQNGFFLSIPPNSLKFRYVSLSMTGTGSPDITVTAYLMNESEWSAYSTQPANYTP